jgi:O-antigen ligase
MKWLDLTERILLIILSGFMVWPNAVSTSALVFLILIRIVREPRKLRPDSSFWWLLIPVYLSIGSWSLVGMPAAGGLEIKHWLIWIAALLYFKSSQLHWPFFSKVFVWTNSALALLFLIYFSAIGPINDGSIGQNLRDTIDATFRIHPTYLTLIWCLTLLVLWRSISIRPISKASISAILIFMISLSGGKMPLIAMAVTAITYLLMEAQLSLTKKSAILILGILGITGLLFTPVLGERFSETIEASTNYQEGDLLSSTDLRLGIWKCTAETVSENWIWGVGTGNSREVLDECYQQYEQIEFFEGEYNTHNQFLHYWLTTGVFGFLFFTTFILAFWYVAMKRGNTSLVYFMLFFGLVMLTENYLCRQKGMMVFAFFAASMFYSPRLD